MIVVAKYFWLPVVVAMAVGVSPSAAFTDSSMKTRRKIESLTSLAGDNLNDLEKARQDFEILIGPQMILDSDARAPLTPSSRMYRFLEMELLDSLRDSDDAVDDLMCLWLEEKGEEAASLLKKMEDKCSTGLVEEERILREMVGRHGLDWPEPLHRLAALLYYKGRSEESMEWCEQVLKAKPWHFEAVHTQLMNSCRLGLDERYKLKLARRALPPLNPSKNNARRRLWVEEALNDARESLEAAEKKLLLFQEKAAEKDNKLQKELNLWQ